MNGTLDNILEEPTAIIMADSKEEIIKVLSMGAMLSILACLIRALLVKKEPLIVRLRIFLAGVLMGTLIAFLMRGSNMNQFLKESIIVCTSSFASSLWPLLESLFLKWVTKKGEELTGRDDK